MKSPTLADLEEIFDNLQKNPTYPADPDLRIDSFGFTVLRGAHGAAHFLRVARRRERSGYREHSK